MVNSKVWPFFFLLNLPHQSFQIATRSEYEQILAGFSAATDDLYTRFKIIVDFGIMINMNYHVPLVKVAAGKQNIDD